MRTQWEHMHSKGHRPENAIPPRSANDRASRHGQNGYAVSSKAAASCPGSSLCSQPNLTMWTSASHFMNQKLLNRVKHTVIPPPLVPAHKPQCALNSNKRQILRPNLSLLIGKIQANNVVKMLLPEYILKGTAIFPQRQHLLDKREQTTK